MPPQLRRLRDAIEALQRQDRVRQLIGTADYIAPEQTRNSRAIDVRADIYGLGATMYQVLTGRSPGGLRPLSVLGVAAVVWGWGVAQYPVLLPGTTVTLTNAGATQATFVALVVVAVAAVLLVIPSFILLFTLQGRRKLSGSQEHVMAPNKVLPKAQA